MPLSIIHNSQNMADDVAAEVAAIERERGGRVRSIIPLGVKIGVLWEPRRDVVRPGYEQRQIDRMQAGDGYQRGVR